MTSSPGPGPSQSTPRWWLAINGTAQGPYEQNHLLAWLQSRQLDIDALVCPEGGQQWQCARLWPAFASAAATPMANPWPAATAVPPQNAPGRQQDIQKLAASHRHFTLGILGLCAAYVLVVVFPLLLVPVLASQLWLCLSLAGALHLSTPWLWAIASVFPYFGMLALLVLSRKATKTLQAAGVPVGLFGPRR